MGPDPWSLLKSLLNQAVIHADPPAGKRSDPPDEKQHVISIVPPGINVLLDDSKNSTTRWSSLEKTPQRPLEAHLATFDATLQELIQLIEPQKTNTYTVPRLPNRVLRFSWFSIPCRTKICLVSSYKKFLISTVSRKTTRRSLLTQSESRNGHAPLTRNRSKTSICTFGVGGRAQSS